MNRALGVGDWRRSPLGESNEHQEGLQWWENDKEGWAESLNQEIPKATRAHGYEPTLPLLTTIHKPAV